MMTTESAPRRTDLDWLRIGAFALLILYHIGMFYVPWEWHVNSTRPVTALEPVMRFFNPWRLGLLFLISGCATAFMLRKMEPGELARSRAARLIPPLLLGMFVIVPPQSYYEVIEKIAWSEGFLRFYARYATGYGGFCRDGDCLIVPIYNHLWFVAYLLAYVLVTAALVRFARPLATWGRDAAECTLRGWGILFWPWLLLAAYRWLLSPWFPSTHYLVDDWYNHALYMSLFLLGVGLARAEAAWRDLVRFRWVASSLSLLAYAAAVVYLDYHDRLGTHPPEWQRFVMRGVYAMQQWCTIAAVLGWGRLLIAADGPVRRYLTDAIFPYYVVHQTVIVVAAFHLARLNLPVALEAGLLVIVTLAGCAASYELVRRVGWLRPWFGLKRAAVPAIGVPARA